MSSTPLKYDSYCNSAWQWMVLDKLKRKSLEIKLSNLVKKEQETWTPVFYDAEGNDKEISAEERLEAAQWQSAASVECGWDIETRFGALCLFDDVMRKVRVGKKFKIPVAAATLCISAKLHDEDQDVKPAPHIIRTVNLDLSPKEITRMEIILLKKLNWNLQSSSVLSFLQIMMGLVTISASIYDKNDLSCESLLTVFLEVQLRILYLLMIRPESCELRPSVLALCVVYFHLDWDNNPALKEDLVPWFQQILMVSDAELAEGLTFSHPVIGNYFYVNLPEESLKRRTHELARKDQFKERVTLYDRLVMEIIYSSEIYNNFNTECHFLCPCAPKSSSKCITTTEAPKHKKCNTLPRIPKPRLLINKIRSGGQNRKRKNHSKKKGNKENFTENGSRKEIM